MPPPLLIYNTVAVVPVSLAYISLASISICFPVEVPPIIKAGLLSALTAKSVFLDKVKVPVSVRSVPSNYAASLVANLVAVLVYNKRSAVYEEFPVPP